MEALRFGISCNSLPVLALEGQFEAKVVLFLGVWLEGRFGQADVYGGMVERGGRRGRIGRRQRGLIEGGRNCGCGRVRAGQDEDRAGYGEADCEGVESWRAHGEFSGGGVAEVILGCNPLVV